LNDPETLEPRKGTMLIAEMPSRVISLQTIGAEVWAVLEGGATICISDLTRDEPSGSLQ
jgi:hypothetical protein